MIFVTLGTQQIPFTRIMRMLDELIVQEHIQDEVVVQAGFTDYETTNFKCIKFLKENEFQEYIAQATVIITHAGSGALFSSIKSGKKVIAVARLSKYGEMIDDHQTELTRKLAEEGYILDGTNSIVEAWKKINSFVPRKNDFVCTIPEVLESIFSNREL